MNLNNTFFYIYFRLSDSWDWLDIRAVEFNCSKPSVLQNMSQQTSRYMNTTKMLAVHQTCLLQIFWRLAEIMVFLPKN